MLNLSNLQQLTKTIKIAPLNIIREHIEMEVLYYLAQSPLAEAMTFYGGTAIRLAYGGLRYSEDLDFSFNNQYSPKHKKQLYDVLAHVVDTNEGVRIEEVISKRQTLFGLLHMTNELLKHPIRVKIEVSKRKDQLQSAPVLLTSPTTNKEIIFSTATMESLVQLKEKAMKQRSMPRDWFDYWYLCQKMRQQKNTSIQFPFPKRAFMNDLKRWLPKDTWVIIDQIVKFYE